MNIIKEVEGIIMYFMELDIKEQLCNMILSKTKNHNKFEKLQQCRKSKDINLLQGLTMKRVEYFKDKAF